MVTFVDKFIWSGLLALGIQFLYIGYRVRFEKVYGYFGTCLILLALMSWGETHPISYFSYLKEPTAWAKLSFYMSLVFLPVGLRFIFEVTGEFQPRGFRALFIAAAALFSFSLLPIHSSPTFPLVALRLGFLGMAFKSFYRGYRNGSPTDRDGMIYLALGTSLMTIGELAEMSPSYSGRSSPNLALVGAGTFALLSVFVLMRRFIALHRANNNVLEKLAAAYAGLGESVKLQALGASAASFTHEIRNYAATLKGNAVLMGRNLAAGEYQAEVTRIRTTAEHIESFTKDVALYARASVPIQKSTVNLHKLVERCAYAWFPEHREKFRFATNSKEFEFEADSQRLEQVFVNFFRNSLEADSRTLETRIRIMGGNLIVALEDDGLGCLPEELDHITKPFFSNKDKTGTGLGCAIAESILKAHGASLRYYSKNALADGQTGLVLNMVFPIEDEEASTKPRKEIPVFTWDNLSRTNLIGPMMNLGLIPNLLPNVEALYSLGKEEGNIPIFLDLSAAQRLPLLWQKSKVIVVGGNRIAQQMKTSDQAPGEEFLFTEERLANLLESLESPK